MAYGHVIMVYRCLNRGLSLAAIDVSRSIRYPEVLGGENLVATAAMASAHTI